MSAYSAVAGVMLREQIFLPRTRTMSSDSLELLQGDMNACDHTLKCAGCKGKRENQLKTPGMASMDI